MCFKLWSVIPRVGLKESRTNSSLKMRNDLFYEPVRVIGVWSYLISFPKMFWNGMVVIFFLHFYLMTPVHFIHPSSAKRMND